MQAKMPPPQGFPFYQAVRKAACRRQTPPADPAPWQPAAGRRRPGGFREPHEARVTAVQWRQYPPPCSSPPLANGSSSLRYLQIFPSK